MKVIFYFISLNFLLRQNVTQGLFMWGAYTHSYAYESRTKITQATWPLSRQPQYYTDPTSCSPWDQALSFTSNENKYSNERTVTTPLSRPKDDPTNVGYDTTAFVLCVVPIRIRMGQVQKNAQCPWPLSRWSRYYTGPASLSSVRKVLPGVRTNGNGYLLPSQIRRDTTPWSRPKARYYFSARSRR